MKNLLSYLIIPALFIVSCKSNGPLAVTKDSIAKRSAENKREALALNQNLMDKDVDAMMVRLSLDFVDFGNSQQAPVKNRDVEKASMKAFVTAFDNLQIKDEKAIAHDDTVIITGTWTGTFTKPFNGAQPTGRVVEFTDTNVYTFDKNHKINSRRGAKWAFDNLHKGFDKK